MQQRKTQHQNAEVIIQCHGNNCTNIMKMYFVNSVKGSDFGFKLQKIYPLQMRGKGQNKNEPRTRIASWLGMAGSVDKKDVWLKSKK